MSTSSKHRKYGIDRIRIFRRKDCSYSVFVMGCCLGDNDDIPNIYAMANGTVIQKETVFSYRYVSGMTGSGKGIYKIPVFTVIFDWPGKLIRLQLFAETGDSKKCIFDISEKIIEGISEDTGIDLNIDEIELSEPTGYIRGWMRHIDGKSLSLELSSDSGEKVRHIINRNCRGDLANAGIARDKNDLGFDVSFPYRDGTKLNLTAYTDDGETISVPAETEKKITRTRMYRAYAGIKGMGLANALSYYSESGKVKGHSEPDKSQCEQCEIYTCPENRNYSEPNYHRWLRLHSPGAEELDEQRKKRFSYRPLISIIVPCYNTDPVYLEEMLESVVNQSYDNWELCIADAGDSGRNDWIFEKYLSLYPDKIKIVKLKKNLGISGNTNEALKLAAGEYAAMLDHDDTLAPDALFSIVSELQKEKYDVLYTDEDKLNADTGLYEEPHFKPDFDPELLRTNNYICHLFCAKLDLIRKVGCYRSEYDGSQDYDIILRCTENGERIRHIPKVLYHWRMHSGSTAEDPESKMYCYVAGEKAIRDHLKRKGIDAEVTMMEKPLYGRYIVKYRLKDKPKVSILIPNRDEKDTLKVCVDSLYEINDYDNFEIVIIENGSNNKETFDYYRELEAQRDNIKVIRWKGTGFNYSSLNNYGVKFAEGEYLLLLNNDTSVITHDAISDMLAICEREEVGIVGAKLLYPDNSIQHAGVIVGLLGAAGHAFSRVPDSAYGYMCRARLTCCCSAVTGACLMISKKLYEDIGGLNETALKVAFNDVDLCLRVRERGYLVVWDAQSYWYHYESKTRGFDLAPENKKRFENEVARFKVIWRERLAEGDPYYSRNWDLYSDTYTTFVK